ncbi:MAG: heat-inducible transcriptional repressor HrcA [Lachnospiraceae bacterium]
MKLDDRKFRILRAIITNYLETGEPVGSRTISKFSDLNLSSATIRNEMADLEDLGYIIQPHTSSGRIPSDTGYRYYVDYLMQQQEDEAIERQKLIQKVDRMENLLKQVAGVLASNTNYATMVTGPRYAEISLKFIQLSQLNPHQILAVIVVEHNVIKNKVIDLEMEITNEELLKLNLILNTFLQGLSLQDINLELMQAMRAQAGDYSQLLQPVFNGIMEAMEEANQLDIYTSGATNILKYPEFSTAEMAGNLLSLFEEKTPLSEFFADSGSEDESDDKIHVYIGDEAPIVPMKNCSIVTATYDVGNGVKGKIGIVGPKRMDYGKVVKTLKNLTDELDDIFKNFS